MTEEDYTRVRKERPELHLPEYQWLLGAILVKVSRPEFTESDLIGARAAYLLCAQSRLDQWDASVFLARGIQFPESPI